MSRGFLWISPWPYFDTMPGSDEFPMSFRSSGGAKQEQRTPSTSKVLQRVSGAKTPPPAVPKNERLKIAWCLVVGWWLVGWFMLG